MVWLDPEPPHAEHTEMECRALLPSIRRQDEGRRFKCEVCKRVWLANWSHEQRDPGPYWTKVTS